MDTFADQNKRRTIRLSSYDYTSCGAYFVTICAHEKRCVFGKIVEGAMDLNVYGKMVRDEWLRTAVVRKNVMLDEFVIMPNHFHGILIITGDANVGATRRVAPTGTLQPNSLGSIIGQFKSLAPKRINTYRTEHDLPFVRMWQRNYYERIIRDEKELNDTRRYIIGNPVNWANDENYR